MKNDTKWNENVGLKDVLVERDSGGSTLAAPAMAVPDCPGIVKIGHDPHAIHGADVEQTREYRFFYLLFFAVFLFVGCIRYVLALSSIFKRTGDRENSIPHPFMEGRSMAKIYVPYIFQL